MGLHKMSRARFSSRNARNNGTINRGVGHKIKKPNAKKKSSNKFTKVRPFGESPPSPKVKPADRVPSETTSPSSSETVSDASRRIFRSRDFNRKATVALSKGIKYQLTQEGLVRSPAPARRGPYKSGKAARPSATSGADLSEEQRRLLAAIESLDSGPQPAAPPRPGTPTQPEDQTPPLRRSPRKHQTASPAAAAGPARPLQPQQPGTPSGGGTPLRRSPRKTPRPPPPAAGTPTHAENEGPTRLTLTPRRSPRKHQQTPRTPQSAVSGASPAGRTPSSVFDQVEEQLMLMEAGEDKENESPQRRKQPEQRPKFYSIFYRRPDGSSGSRGTPAPAQASPSAGTKSRVPARPADDGLEQLVIDAGQRQFGVITCATCTLVYTIGDPEDEATHARHHTGYLSALNFPGWKREYEVGTYPDGRVVMVTPRDAVHAWRKVDSVLSIVDAELGFVGIGVRNKSQSKVFFYVVDRQIVGCLVAEPVSQGFAVLPRDGNSEEAARTGVRCSTEPQPCQAGVSRVWVRRDFRRRQIGTRMVEAMKSHFTVTPLRWQEVAFSDPTPDGLQFAAGVTGSEEFLVYNQ